MTLWVPSSAQQELRFVCRVPTGRDETCGERFASPTSLERHVRSCVLRHEMQTHTESPRQRMPMFNPDNWNPDKRAHAREVGRRMLAEGRWTVLPSEKIYNE